MSPIQNQAVVMMPRLSDAMEDGLLIAWLVPDGTEVSEGDDLAEIETDKATVVYKAPFAGTLSPLVEEGETVAVGAPMPISATRAPLLQLRVRRLRARASLSRRARLGPRRRTGSRRRRWHNASRPGPG